LKSNAVSSDKYLPVLSSNHAVVVSTSSLVASCLLCRHVRYFILIIATHRQIGQQVSGPVILSNPTSGAVNKVFGKQSMQLLDRFLVVFNCVATTRLSPRHVDVSRHCQERDGVEHQHCLLYPIATKEQTYNHLSHHVFHVVFLICLDIVLLVHVLILIDMMRMFRSIHFLYTFVVMVLLYFWIKLKPNVSNKPKTLF
jgi:hypothetical protein